MKQKKTELVQAKVTADLKLKIRKICAKKDCTEGDIIREALKKFFRNQRQITTCGE